MNNPTARSAVTCGTLSRCLRKAEPYPTAISAVSHRKAEPLTYGTLSRTHRKAEPSTTAELAVYVVFHEVSHEDLNLLESIEATQPLQLVFHADEAASRSLTRLTSVAAAVAEDKYKTSVGVQA